MSFASIEDQRCWPEDQRYMGKCAWCQITYFGPKRSCVCFACREEARVAAESLKAAQDASWAGPKTLFKEQEHRGYP